VVGRLLTQPGINPNALNKGGWTALCYAASVGHEAVVRLLIGGHPAALVKRLPCFSSALTDALGPCRQRPRQLRGACGGWQHAAHACRSQRQRSHPQTAASGSGPCFPCPPHLICLREGSWRLGTFPCCVAWASVQKRCQVDARDQSGRNAVHYATSHADHVGTPHLAAFTPPGTALTAVCLAPLLGDCAPAGGGGRGPRGARCAHRSDRASPGLPGSKTRRCSNNCRPCCSCGGAQR
jgi:ankyrin repeat protein